MGKEILTFGDIGTEKNKIYPHKSPIFLDDVDIVKVLVCNNFSSGEKNSKHFIGYFYNDCKVKPFHRTLPKISAHVTSYDGQTKWTYFLIRGDDFLEKYNTVWDKVSADTN